jgi:hypothetical protein
MKMKVVFDKSGEILWTAVHHVETKGEAGIALASGEEAIDVELGEVSAGEEERARHIHQVMADVRKNFHIVNRELKRRDKR